MVRQRLLSMPLCGLKSRDSVATYEDTIKPCGEAKGTVTELCGNRRTQ